MNDSWKEKRILNRLWISFANNNLSNFIPQSEVLLVSYLPNDTPWCKGQVLCLWITCCYTTPHQNTALLWQREGALSKALWMRRADFQTKKHVQTEVREVKASQCWVVKPSSCCRWTHRDAISSQGRGAAGHERCPGAKGERHRAVPALGQNLPCFLPRGAKFTPWLYISPFSFSLKLALNVTCLQKQVVRYQRCCSCIIYYCNSCP